VLIKIAGHNILNNGYVKIFNRVKWKFDQYNLRQGRKRNLEIHKKINRKIWRQEITWEL